MLYMPLNNKPVNIQRNLAKMVPAPAVEAAKPIQPEPPPAPPKEEPPIPALPSMTTMAKNLMGSMVKNAVGIVKGEQIVLDQVQISHRMIICNACEYFRKHDQRCSRCGCWMKLKTVGALERCIIGKW